MFSEFLSMGGYSQFVWPAFAFSFSSCLYLFFKTKSELKKHEVLFSKEFEIASSEKIEFNKRKISTIEILSTN
tara:strand:+ start:162 stop:380 length:219 start_codon:yes stop_codon:yes gene_type:complete